MNYKIGLYIGHSYIGWATLELDSKNEPFKIIDVGSRVFDNTNINKNIFHPDLIHINCKDEKPVLLPTNAPELEIIYDPAVRQSIFQLIKIINSIIKRYNKSPSFISLKFDDKLLNLDKNINARDKYIENAEKNILIKKIYNNFKKLDVTDVDLVKLKLWEEQDGVCPYSLKKICIERLFDVGYVDIDHIIAYSKCFDDSYNNKVLVFSGENHKKGDLLPLQYVKNKNDFIVWVSSTFRNQNKDKKDRLLMDCLSIEEEKSLKLQNINDTTYISNFIINYITKYLKISSNNANESNLVVSYSKGLFSYLMIKWAISKIKEYGDINNAINAIVVAHMTDNIIEKIEKYSKAYELRYLSTHKEEDKHIDNFPIPYHNFKTEIKSYIQKNPIQILDIFNKKDNTKSNINHFYENKNIIFVSQMSNKSIFDVFYTKNLENLNIPTNNFTVRIDIFKLPNNEYYLIPRYATGVIENQFFDEETILAEQYIKNKELNNENFVFSLYHNDLIRIKTKEGKHIRFNMINKNEFSKDGVPDELILNDVLCYYKSANISSTGIKVNLHNNMYTAKYVGIKSLASIEKYQVDILGKKFRLINGK